MDGGHEEDENDEDIDDLVQLPQSQPANSKTSKTVPAETKPASLNGDFIILKKYRIIVLPIFIIQGVHPFFVGGKSR